MKKLVLKRDGGGAEAARTEEALERMTRHQLIAEWVLAGVAFAPGVVLLAGVVLGVAKALMGE